MTEFEWGDTIGSGGFGVVLEAKCLEDGSPCVVKKLKAGLTPTALKRFKREIRIQSQMDHEHVVEIIGFNTEDTPPWFAMPRAVESVEDRLRRERGEAALWMFSGLAEGVKYLHENGVIHRDLKPSNGLIFQDDKNEWVCVSDLGLGRFMDRDSTVLTVDGLGTPAYAAPEQWNDFANVDIRADIYAMGKILYAVLTGEVPYPWMDFLKVPRKFVFIVQKATKEDPSERYQTLAEMMNDYELVTTSSLLDSPSEAARKMLEELLASQEFTKAAVEPLARLLAENADDYTMQVRITPKLPVPVLKRLAKSFPDYFRQILNGYDEHVSGSLSFDYCDTVANFYSLLFLLTDDDEIRMMILSRLPVLGYDHNRWHVRSTFANLVAGLKDPVLILGVRDVLRKNPSAAAWCAEALTNRSIPKIIRTALKEAGSEDDEQDA